MAFDFKKEPEDEHEQIGMGAIMQKLADADKKLKADGIKGVNISHEGVLQYVV